MVYEKTRQVIVPVLLEPQLHNLRVVQFYNELRLFILRSLYTQFKRNPTSGMCKSKSNTIINRSFDKYRQAITSFNCSVIWLTVLVEISLCLIINKTRNKNSTNKIEHEKSIFLRFFFCN
jgi:hypothetical protein